MRAKFEIVTCKSSHVKFVELELSPKDAGRDGGDLAVEYTGFVLECGGLNNRKCGGCYDFAYRVKFAGWLEPTGECVTVEFNGHLVHVNYVDFCSLLGSAEDSMYQSGADDSDWAVWNDLNDLVASDD